ncbi:MAG: YkgJ family cysteine cluster protein [Novosphingobium sp.]
MGFPLAMDLHFDCTQCGRCCHDLRLTLSVDEARTWAGRGHQVDLLAEGWPWPDNGDPNDALIQWRKATSFEVQVGDVPFRINLRLVARHIGPCPHLLPDMRCGNYDERPRICRIYPLESRPFEAASPAGRKCPPEAWRNDLPLLQRDGVPASGEAQALLSAHRQAMIDDVALKARLASALGFADTAFAGEGMAVCEIAPPALLTALEEAELGLWDATQHWTIVTNRQSTAKMLADLDCPARLVSAGSAFLPTFADEH